MTDFMLITCEHGGNTVPAAYRSLFRGQAALLRTHRGFDRGALLMAGELAAAFRAPLVSATVTRLLVDLNRSVGHPRLHGERVRALPPAAREAILAAHYRPYRSQVEALAARAIARGRRVVHIASHSFTPELDGKLRSADVGLLYDPGRAGEVRLCAHWKAAFARADPQLRVRRNYPYAGKDDGLLPHLRSRFAPAAYVGIEIELNQSFCTGAPRRFAHLRHTVIDTLRAALAAER
jgi:predicted N-formylglutamate amidohydrolase